MPALKTWLTICFVHRVPHRTWPLEEVAKDIAKLRQKMAEGSGQKADLEELEALQDFEQDLKDFREELLRVAQLPYKPNLNDGVLITASPLNKLFRLPKWRKDLEECWKKLSNSDYEWAHLAYSIWPDRVKEVCKRDRSIAIAHGLEHLCEVAAPKAKSKKKKKSPAVTEEMFEEQ